MAECIICKTSPLIKRSTRTKIVRDFEVLESFCSATKVPKAKGRDLIKKYKSEGTAKLFCDRCEELALHLTEFSNERTSLEKEILNLQQTLCDKLRSLSPLVFKVEKLLRVFKSITESAAQPLPTSSNAANNDFSGPRYSDFSWLSNRPVRKRYPKVTDYPLNYVVPQVTHSDYDEEGRSINVKTEEEQTSAIEHVEIKEEPYDWKNKGGHEFPDENEDQFINDLLNESGGDQMDVEDSYTDAEEKTYYHRKRKSSNTSETSEESDDNDEDYQFSANEDEEAASNERKASLPKGPSSNWKFDKSEDEEDVEDKKKVRVIRDPNKRPYNKRVDHDPSFSLSLSKVVGEGKTLRSRVVNPINLVLKVRSEAELAAVQKKKEEKQKKETIEIAKEKKIRNKEWPRRSTPRVFVPMSEKFTFLGEINHTENGKLFFREIEIIRKEERDIFVFECSRCGHEEMPPKDSPTANDSVQLATTRMRRHIVVDHCGGYECPICKNGKKYKLYKHYVSHTRSKHTMVNEPDILCEDCGKPFRATYIYNPAIINRHRFTHKNAEEQAEAIKRGEAIPLTPKLRKRPSTPPATKDFLCGQCGKSFLHLTSLIAHEKRHDPSFEEKAKAKVPCPQCGKVVNAHTLKMHQRTVHAAGARQRYSCIICPKSFLVKNNLRDHIIAVHSDERPHVCTICSKAYALAHQLRFHMVAHENEERNELISCPKCPYTANRMKTFKKHFDRLHDPKKSEGKNFFCSICSRGYLTESSLNNHIKHIHGPDRKFAMCPVCDKKCATNWVLQRHIKTLHPESVGSTSKVDGRRTGNHRERDLENSSSSSSSEDEDGGQGQTGNNNPQTQAYHLHHPQQSSSTVTHYPVLPGSSQGQGDLNSFIAFVPHSNSYIHYGF